MFLDDVFEVRVLADRNWNNQAINEYTKSWRRHTEYFGHLCHRVYSVLFNSWEKRAV
jgi:hypothetical protein